MRVAIGIHGCDIDRAVEIYNLLSERSFTHANLTLFNAGTFKPQMSSCFLVYMKDDCIYDASKQCTMISKATGGIRLNLRCSRSTRFVFTLPLFNYPL